LPVRAGVEVVSVTAGGGGYQVTTSAGTIAARAVVVAGGGQRCPVIPGLAARLPAGIHQTDAGHYRSPAGLPPRAVPGVGGGQAGAQAADGLATSGRRAP